MLNKCITTMYLYEKTCLITKIYDCIVFVLDNLKKITDLTLILVK